MMKHLFYIVPLAVLLACQNKSVLSDKSSLVGQIRPTEQSTKVNSIGAAPRTTRLVLPEGVTYQVIFQEGDLVIANGNSVPAKGGHDCNVFLPKNANEGLLFVGHETRQIDPVLGDGGGATLLDLKLIENEWKISNKRNVDYSSVGFTANNCGGKITSRGTVLSAEEICPRSNAELVTYMSDLSDVNGLKRFENFGWMVEVDPVSGKALQKLISMGRFSHEDALCLDDGKTVFLTNDGNPAIFYKFVADQKGDYATGQLYAFQQKSVEEKGNWLPLPMDTTSLINANVTAMKLGASLFQRHEWLTKVDDKIYISETGMDTANWEWAVELGAAPAPHFVPREVKPGVFDDPYGRILEYDLNTGIMKPYIEGGYSSDSTTNFASPDCINHVKINKQEYLVISEDIGAEGFGRMDEAAHLAGFWVNELFLLDISIKNPTVDDLIRFAAAPTGSETTGIYFTEDQKTMFLNIQHPYEKNPAPFNKSTTIAITGY